MASADLVRGEASTSPGISGRLLGVAGHKTRLVAGWAVVAVLIAGVWELLAVQGLVNPILSGRPSGIATAFVNQLTTPDFVTNHVFATLSGTLLGFALASVAAIIVAFAISQSKLLRGIIDPYFAAFNSLPRVALAPIFLVWFGLGIQSKIAMSASLAFFVVFYNTMAGIDAVDRDHLLLARSLGSSRRDIFLRFIMPSSVPSIFTGLQLGLVYGMLGTISGEMIAGERGLGVLLTRQAALFQMNEYFATLLALIIITTTLSVIVDRIRKRLLRWQDAHTASSS